MNQNINKLRNHNLQLFIFLLHIIFCKFTDGECSILESFYLFKITYLVVSNRKIKNVHIVNIVQPVYYKIKISATQIINKESLNKIGYLTIFCFGHVILVVFWKIIFTNKRHQRWIEKSSMHIIEILIT